MIILTQKLDEITYMAVVKDRLMIVYEFENELALCIHLQEIKLALDFEQRKIDL
jgi:hypothetical protein